VGGRSAKYPPELGERAVRMVAEVRPDYPSDWPAICAVARKLGTGSAETLRKWVHQAEVDVGTRPGVSTEESAEIKRLKRENAELRRTNEKAYSREPCRALRAPGRRRSPSMAHRPCVMSGVRPEPVSAH
jgi:transposase